MVASEFQLRPELDRTHPLCCLGQYAASSLPGEPATLGSMLIAACERGWVCQYNWHMPPVIL
jgi:hypothetical protein